jgi:hypothetical protein
MNIFLIAWLIAWIFSWSFQFFCNSSLIELIFIEFRNVCNVNCNTCARHDTCTIFHFYFIIHFIVFFIVFLENYIHTTRYDVQILDKNQKKKNDIVWNIVNRNNQNTSLNVVSRQNLLDYFRQNLVCMFFVHIFKFDQYFMIFSNLVYEEDDYKQVWLTIRDKSTIQNKRHFDFIKKIFE